MIKKVLLTGATGFIGKHIILPLQSRGFEIHAVTSKQCPESLNSNLTWHQIDLMHKSSIVDLIKSHQFSHLCHFAWEATPGKYWTSLTNLDWIEASIHLARTFIQHGGKRIVVSGTCAEYEWKEDTYLERQTPFIPSTLYGSCKRSFYLVLKALCEQLNISFAWGYIFFLYGPHEHPKRFVPSIIRGLLGKDPVMCSEGFQIRDFMHVKDVASAFAALLDSNVTGGLNIASGEGISLRELAKIVSEMLGGKEKLLFGALPTSANEPRCLLPDVRRLREELRWVPSIGLREGIEEAVSWWKKNL